MDLLFPHDDRDRSEFKDSAAKIGFEELTAECTANVHLLQPHDRLSVLLMAWKKIGDYLTQNQYAPCVGDVVGWVGRYTLDLWFGRDWIACSTENKTSLIEHMMKVFPAAYITTHPYSWPYMFSIYRDPWMVEYLNVNFQRMNGPDTTSEELEPIDSEFIQQEGISLIILRMINMFEFCMIKLVKHMCLRLLLAWQDTTSTANRAMHATPNAAQYIDYVTHIYLIAICESNGTTDLHYVLECIQRNLHCNAIETGPIEKPAQIIAKGLRESNKTLTEFLNGFLLKIPDRNYNNYFGGAVNKYVMFLTEYQIRKIHTLSSLKLLLPYDEVYGKLVQMFIKQRESSEELVKTTAAVSEKLFSGVHNLQALKLSYEQVKLRIRSEWYTTKITLLLGIISEVVNSLEECKYTDDQAVDEILVKEQELAVFYRDLAKLLTKIPYLEQEAWLTTFSLHPCKEYMDAVIKCGSRNLRAIKKQAQKFKPISDPESKTLKNTEEEEVQKTIVNKEEEKSTSDPLSKTHELAAGVVDAVDLPSTSSAFLATLATEVGVILKEENKEEVKKEVQKQAKEAVQKEDKEVATVTIKCTKTKKIPNKNITTKGKRGPRNKITTDKKPTKTTTKVSRGRPVGTVKSKKSIEKKSLKDFNKKPVTTKSDTKDRDSAEVIYAAAAGAADSLTSQTAESIKYPVFALINFVTDTEDLIKYTDYNDEIDQYKELNRILSKLRLQISIYDDILALLIAPRYKRLSWSISWKLLKKRCRGLLTKDVKKKQLVQQYMADANDRLTHLNIDYDKYKDKPQIDYGTIEGGYECFDVEAGENGLKPVVADSKKEPKIKPPTKRSVKGNKSALAIKATSKKVKPSEGGTSVNEEIIRVLHQETIDPVAGTLETYTTRSNLSSPIFLNQLVYIVRRTGENSTDLMLSPQPMPASTTNESQMASYSQIVTQDGHTIKTLPNCSSNTSLKSKNPTYMIYKTPTSRSSSRHYSTEDTLTSDSFDERCKDKIGQDKQQANYTVCREPSDIPSSNRQQTQFDMLPSCSTQQQYNVLSNGSQQQQQQQLNIQNSTNKQQQTGMLTYINQTGQPHLLQQPRKVSSDQQSLPIVLPDTIQQQPQKVLTQVISQASQGNTIQSVRMPSKPTSTFIPKRPAVDQPEDLTITRPKLMNLMPLNLTAETSMINFDSSTQQYSSDEEYSEEEESGDEKEETDHENDKPEGFDQENYMPPYQQTCPTNCQQKNVRIGYSEEPTVHSVSEPLPDGVGQEHDLTRSSWIEDALNEDDDDDVVITNVISPFLQHIREPAVHSVPKPLSDGAEEEQELTRSSSIEDALNEDDDEDVVITNVISPSLQHIREPTEHSVSEPLSDGAEEEQELTRSSSIEDALNEDDDEDVVITNVISPSLRHIREPTVHPVPEPLPDGAGHEQELTRCSSIEDALDEDEDEDEDEDDDDVLITNVISPSLQHITEPAVHSVPKPLSDGAEEEQELTRSSSIEDALDEDDDDVLITNVISPSLQRIREPTVHSVPETLPDGARKEQKLTRSPSIGVVLNKSVDDVVVTKDVNPSLQHIRDMKKFGIVWEDDVENDVLDEKPQGDKVVASIQSTATIWNSVSISSDLASSNTAPVTTPSASTLQYMRTQRVVSSQAQIITKLSPIGIPITKKSAPKTPTPEFINALRSVFHKHRNLPLHKLITAVPNSTRVVPFKNTSVPTSKVAEVRDEMDTILDRIQNINDNIPKPYSATIATPAAGPRSATVVTSSENSPAMFPSFQTAPATRSTTTITSSGLVRGRVYPPLCQIDLGTRSSTVVTPSGQIVVVGPLKKNLVQSLHQTAPVRTLVQTAPARTLVQSAPIRTSPATMVAPKNLPIQTTTEINSTAVVPPVKKTLVQTSTQTAPLPTSTAKVVVTVADVAVQTTPEISSAAAVPPLTETAVQPTQVVSEVEDPNTIENLPQNDCTNPHKKSIYNSIYSIGGKLVSPLNSTCSPTQSSSSSPQLTTLTATNRVQSISSAKVHDSVAIVLRRKILESKRSAPNDFSTADVGHKTPTDDTAIKQVEAAVDAVKESAAVAQSSLECETRKVSASPRTDTERQIPTVAETRTPAVGAPSITAQSSSAVYGAFKNTTVDILNKVSAGKASVSESSDILMKVAPAVTPSASKVAHPVSAVDSTLETADVAQEIAADTENKNNDVEAIAEVVESIDTGMKTTATNVALKLSAAKAKLAETRIITPMKMKTGNTMDPQVEPTAKVEMDNTAVSTKSLHNVNVALNHPTAGLTIKMPSDEAKIIETDVTRTKVQRNYIKKVPAVEVSISVEKNTSKLPMDETAVSAKSSHNEIRKVLSFDVALNHPTTGVTIEMPVDETKTIKADFTKMKVAAVAVSVSVKENPSKLALDTKAPAKSLHNKIRKVSSTDVTLNNPTAGVARKMPADETKMVKADVTTTKVGTTDTKKVPAVAVSVTVEECPSKLALDTTLPATSLHTEIKKVSSVDAAIELPTVDVTRKMPAALETKKISQIQTKKTNVNVTTTKLPEVTASPSLKKKSKLSRDQTVVTSSSHNEPTNISASDAALDISTDSVAIKIPAVASTTMVGSETITATALEAIAADAVKVTAASKVAPDVTAAPLPSHADDILHILHNKDMVLNSNLLDPRLKTYRNNKAPTKTVEKIADNTYADAIVDDELFSLISITERSEDGPLGRNEIIAEKLFSKDWRKKMVRLLQGIIEPSEEGFKALKIMITRLKLFNKSFDEFSTYDSHDRTVLERAKYLIFNLLFLEERSKFIKNATILDLVQEGCATILLAHLNEQINVKTIETCLQGAGLDVVDVVQLSNFEPQSLLRRTGLEQILSGHFLKITVKPLHKTVNAIKALEDFVQATRDGHSTTIYSPVMALDKLRTFTLGTLIHYPAEYRINTDEEVTDVSNSDYEPENWLYQMSSSETEQSRSTPAPANKRSTTQLPTRKELNNDKMVTDSSNSEDESQIQSNKRHSSEGDQPLARPGTASKWTIKKLPEEKQLNTDEEVADSLNSEDESEKQPNVRPSEKEQPLAKPCPISKRSIKKGPARKQLNTDRTVTDSSNSEDESEKRPNMKPFSERGQPRPRPCPASKRLIKKVPLQKQPNTDEEVTDSSNSEDESKRRPNKRACAKTDQPRARPCPASKRLAKKLPMQKQPNTDEELTDSSNSEDDSKKQPNKRTSSETEQPRVRPCPASKRLTKMIPVQQQSNNDEKVTDSSNSEDESKKRSNKRPWADIEQLRARPCPASKRLTKKLPVQQQPDTDEKVTDSSNSENESKRQSNKRLWVETEQPRARPCPASKRLTKKLPVRKQPNTDEELTDYSNSEDDSKKQPNKRPSSEIEQPSTSKRSTKIMRKQPERASVRRNISERTTNSPTCSTRTTKSPQSEDCEHDSDTELNTIYECATISTTNDSDDDDGSDYVPGNKQQKVVKPMKLRCVSRRTNADHKHDSSTVTTVRRRYFAAKSTSKRAFPVRPTSSRTQRLLSVRKPMTITKVKNVHQLTASDRAAILRYNCVELEVSLSRLTPREIEMWRKPNIKVSRDSVVNDSKERKSIVAEQDENMDEGVKESAQPTRVEKTDITGLAEQSSESECEYVLVDIPTFCQQSALDLSRKQQDNLEENDDQEQTQPVEGNPTPPESQRNVQNPLYEPISDDDDGPAVARSRARANAPQMSRPLPTQERRVNLPEGSRIMNMVMADGQEMNVVLPQGHSVTIIEESPSTGSSA